MPHAAELHSPVRALAHRLANGKISWVDYRNERAAVVEAIVNGDELSYSRPVIFEDTTMPKEQALSQVYIDVDELERVPRRWPAYVATGALGVALVGAAWVLWESSRPPVVAEAPVVVMSGAEAALREFIEAGDWSAEAVAAAGAAWTGYSAEQRAEARASVTWRRAQMQVRERINQQRVLKTVDESGEAAAQERRLMEFQRALQQ